MYVVCIAYNVRMIALFMGQMFMKTPKAFVKGLTVNLHLFAVVLFTVQVLGENGISYSVLYFFWSPKHSHTYYTILHHYLFIMSYQLCFYISLYSPYHLTSLEW